MNEFFTWGVLGTYAGSVLATGILTQLFKEVSFLKKIPTRVFSYVVAFAVLLLSHLFAGDFSVATAALCLVNAAVVSLASNGAYDTIHNLNKKPNDGDMQEQMEKRIEREVEQQLEDLCKEAVGESPEDAEDPDAAEDDPDAEDPDAAGDEDPEAADAGPEQ